MFVHFQVKLNLIFFVNFQIKAKMLKPKVKRVRKVKKVKAPAPAPATE